MIQVADTDGDGRIDFEGGSARTTGPQEPLRPFLARPSGTPLYVRCPSGHNTE